MSVDAGLVGCLVERIATRLPHRTGSQAQDLYHDEVVVVTRATLAKLSSRCLDIVLDSLLAVLENLARPYKAVMSHPPLVLLSELYTLEVVAECCSSYWQGGRDPSLAAHEKTVILGQADLLDEALVSRIFEAIKILWEPIPDGFVLPGKTILDECSSKRIAIQSVGHSSHCAMVTLSGEPLESSRLLKAHAASIESQIRKIVEFVTASSWSHAFEYFRQAVYTARTAMHSSQPLVSAVAEEERSALIVLRLVSSFWVGVQQLGLIIQEFCSSFLHLRKPFQNTIAIVTPLLITRWLDRHPAEFVQLHMMQKRRDNSPDTLFEMTQTGDNAKRRALLYPLQTSLLFLLPDVFVVASNLRDATSSSITKKMNFLESLRKALRNRNEQAAYCLVSLLRVARHFKAESESALLSYAMDVQDEVRDAVFCRFSPGADGVLFEQDVTTAAFVSLAHLSFEDSIDSLAPVCLAPTAPHSFKISLIQTCSHFARLSDNGRYQSLFTAASTFIQGQLRTVSGLVKESFAGELSAQRRVADSPATISMICNILHFLDASPMTLFEGPPPDRAGRDRFYCENLESLVSCVIAANESIRSLAISVAKRLFDKGQVLHALRASKQLESPAFRANFWRSTAVVLNSMCDGAGLPATDGGLQSIQTYLGHVLLLLKAVPELSELSEDLAARRTAFGRLETLFLISLCSADLEVCQQVTSCLGVFLDLCRIMDAASDVTKSSLTFIRSGDVFGEISSPSFRMTGLVAFQKRNRGLLRRMAHASASIVDAWEVAFDKWTQLCKDVSTAAPDAVAERTVAEWRNYSGFLASLGGICMADHAASHDDANTAGLRWIDQLPVDGHKDSPVNRYLRLSMQLLACVDVRVRETMRDVLSTEVSSALYQPLFKTIESELDLLFIGALEPTLKGQDNDIVFAEQTASLLKALVERLDGPSDLGAASSVHLGALALNFAKFLDGVPDTPNRLRVKIKICQLAEVVMRRKEQLNLRDDVRIRNKLLESIFSWIARPRSPKTENAHLAGGGRHEEAARVQRDLDKACLKCLAELTFRLPLQPGDGQNDAGTSELKSQMFHQYFNRFLSLLNLESAETRGGEHVGGAATRDESASASDLAISILSNLLSANIDVGLKHSLSIGYHENVEIRTAFVKVLYNILAQGTEFNNLSDAAVIDKYNELLGLLTNDTSLAAAMSAVCPSHEVDELTVSLLNIFETRGLGFTLIEALMRQEVEGTENESELLRRTCVATKILSVYARWKGAGYLRLALQKVVERLMLTCKDLHLELDPTRIKTAEELDKNAMQLQIVAKVFIDDICASAAAIPPSFRTICSIISSAVMPRYQEAKYTAVGAFIFLRFFCPAIVAPEVEGLVSTPPSKEMRRGLLLIAKIIQNLANNVLFGAKEPYMFPLNDFLTQNIYRVTAFLRDISVPPESLETSTAGESFDFGSCVALHRFLYDHWDPVRQRLVSQERRDMVRSPSESSRGRSPVLESLQKLISNLGPPPLAVTWNRPQISTNSPPAYSRFQDFMFRNESRGSESFLTARAVYDGGESKDGLSIICVILRHVESESMDYDTLLFCYLKIASRLWHRPFGLLIDATCYGGLGEPRDEVLQKIELLTPRELSRQLQRIYVYNMNSVCRKGFRRVLRMSSRNEHSIFNPQNVDYLLIGSLQDLQTYFHLSQLHLPKETISVVTDTRYVFQSITRLSKTKGKIEVVIKVGSQFVQITTTKKQDVYPGFRLSTTVNDIFRLGDVDEAPASTQADDEAAFGLRADNGKVVMYFTSPKKADVLQAMRAAKARHGKDTRSLKPFERLMRPQDVPGTLLNLALTNLSSPDGVLRRSSYNLLGALCTAFKFSAASSVMPTRDLAVPPHPSGFVVAISQMLARAEPQLTADFLNEFFVGWDSFSDEQKPLSLAYMAPWIPGLRTGLLASGAESETGRDKIAGLFRKLIDVALSDPALHFALEQSVWPMISKDELLLDLFLDETVRTAVDAGFDDEHTATLTAILNAMATVTLRGKIMSRLRKTLHRSSMRPTRQLPDNAVWPEICVLLQFCVALSFASGLQAQLYSPETFHIATMLANTGSAEVRLLVRRLLVNTMHAASSSFQLDEPRQSRLRSVLDTLAESRCDLFANAAPLPRHAVSAAAVLPEAGPALTTTESLATLVFEACSLAAPCADMANAWRSRWMSLVASTAFQNNPAIQPRAFTVMGCLAREEVDDDLLYQVLVALRTSVGRFGDDGSSDLLVAIVTSLSKMMAKLPSASRYGLQLFWLAMSLLRLVPPALFNCTAVFLESVLTNISTATHIKGPDLAAHLLQGRVQLEDAALPLDEAYGIHFSPDNFHFAACACLVRGLSDSATKATALRVLSTFLQISSWSPSGRDKSLRDLATSPYMALILARTASLGELRDSLWSAGINPSGLSDVAGLRALQDVAVVKDKVLLLSTAIELVDFQCLQDAVQTRLLQWLNGIAMGRPAVILHLCGPVVAILDDVLLHCENSATLQSAHALLQTLTSNAQFASALQSANKLNDSLHDMGFGGLWRSCSLNVLHQQDKQCFVWTEKLIELIII